MIPLIAIVFGGGVAASEVGVGAILGAPFMLTTLAMFVTGAAVLLMRKRRVNREDLVVDPGVLGHDMALLRPGLRGRGGGCAAAVGHDRAAAADGAGASRRPTPGT